MSVSYWAIEGYGVNTDDIFPYVNKEKVNKIVKEQMPNEEFDGDIFEDDTFCGNPYMNFADFLLTFDHKGILTYDDDGQNTSYLLYTPCYPWMTKTNEIKTEESVKDYIVDVLKNVCDASSDELKEYIDYISTYGAS